MIKQLFTSMLVFVAIAAQAQQPQAVFQWGQSSTSKATAEAIVGSQNGVLVSVDTEGDNTIPSEGYSDVRLYNLNPQTGVAATPLVLGGIGIDRTAAPMVSCGDTIYAGPRSSDGTLSTLGLNDTYNSAPQPRIVQLVNGNLTKYFKPQAQWGGISLHAVLRASHSVWAVCTREAGGPAMNGVTNQQGWKSVCITKLSRTLQHQSTWFYGCQPNQAGVDTVENVKACLTTPDGAYIVVVGELRPATAGSWYPQFTSEEVLGWALIIDTQTGEAREFHFPHVHTITSVAMMPGSKDLLMLGTGLSGPDPYTQIIRVSTETGETTPEYEVHGPTYDLMAVLPDGSAVFYEPSYTGGMSISFTQVDLLADTVRSTYTIPVSGANEYVRSMNVDYSDNTIVFAGYGHSVNGGPSTTTFPVTYSANSANTSAIAGKAQFPLGTLLTTSISEQVHKTSITTVLEASQTYQLPTMAQVQIISSSGVLVRSYAKTTEYTTPNTPGLYVMYITTAKGSTYQRILVN